MGLDIGLNAFVIVGMNAVQGWTLSLLAIAYLVDAWLMHLIEMAQQWMEKNRLLNTAHGLACVAVVMTQMTRPITGTAAEE